MTTICLYFRGIFKQFTIESYISYVNSLTIVQKIEYYTVVAWYYREKLFKILSRSIDINELTPADIMQLSEDAYLLVPKLVIKQKKYDVFWYILNQKSEYKISISSILDYLTDDNYYRILELLLIYYTEKGSHDNPLRNILFAKAWYRVPEKLKYVILFEAKLKNISVIEIFDRTLKELEHFIERYPQYEVNKLYNAFLSAGVPLSYFLSKELSFPSIRTWSSTLEEDI